MTTTRDHQSDVLAMRDAEVQALRAEVQQLTRVNIELEAENQDLRREAEPKLRLLAKAAITEFRNGGGK